jgi:hypothetical protein
VERKSRCSPQRPCEKLLTAEVVEEFAEIAEKGGRVERSFASLKMTTHGFLAMAILLGGGAGVCLLYG